LLKKTGRQRSSRIRAGRRLLGIPDGLMIEENGQGAGDQVFESNGVKLFIDPISIRYLKGASRLRRYGDRRRIHDQEPERDVHVRLRLLVLRRLIW
jgi:hypothetical protein